VYANTGNGNAAVGAANGPVVAVVTGTNGGAGVAITNMAVTGLTQATQYGIYCATNDATKVLSNPVVTFTTLGGFSTQPTAGSITNTGVTISATPSDAKDIKCGVFANGATAPTADQVYANTGNGNAAVGAANGPVVAVVTGTNGGAGVAITNMAVTGLTQATQYGIYCATNDATKVLSNPVVTFTTTATCDGSTAPTWGTKGDCTNAVAAGSTCQPTCNPGYTVSGTASCGSTGVFTPATCAACTGGTAGNCTTGCKANWYQSAGDSAADIVCSACQNGGTIAAAAPKNLTASGAVTCNCTGGYTGADCGTAPVTTTATPTVTTTATPTVTKAAADVSSAPSAAALSAFSGLVSLVAAVTMF